MQASTYPSFQIQPDWNRALHDKDDCIWLHQYSQGGTSYHKLSIQEEGFVSDCGDFDCTIVSPNLLQLTSKLRDFKRTFQCPDSIHSSNFSGDKRLKTHLSCMDMSPSGELILSATSDHVVSLWESSTGHVRRTLEGHVGEVYTCRFFPSGLAALTGGADMQLKIWCLLSGRCAATLAPGCAGALTGNSPSHPLEPGGHRAGVLDTGILNRGRNIVAIDRSGWLRLWDVSTQTCISGIPLVPSANLAQANRVVCEEATCLAVKVQPGMDISGSQCLPDQSSWYQVYETASRKATEVGTANALVAVGMGIGAAVQLYEVDSRQKGCVARVTLPNNSGAVESIAFVQRRVADEVGGPIRLVADFDHPPSSFLDNALFAGGQNGELACWDLRSLKNPIWQLTGEKGAVHFIRAVDAQDGQSAHLIVGRSDGRVMVYLCSPATNAVRHRVEFKSVLRSTLELTGINCEPIRGIAARSPVSGTGLSVCTASLSGVFRFYRELATDVAFHI
ncbi:unnamed protein product [Calicophoron daubneyi]|uniref:Proteasomal ATPase-associated factor 1 n=1 Tax=Calicophoron daubneyi TaxID=300641 RepID=A0AAV2TKL4_CALDB